MDSHCIKKFAASLGLSCVGIAPARLPVPAGYGDEICPLAAGKGTERYEPERLLPGCASVIVALFPYYAGKEYAGNLSLYCRSTDYHTVTAAYLEKISAYVTRSFGGRCRCIADTSPLDDRWLAYCAGLGFFGDNRCFFHDTYGSYVFIGSVLTTVPFAPDRPQAKECLHCGACRRACPGQCFSGGTYHYQRCKSYLTQKKGSFTLPELNIMGKTPSVFGCDVCQLVCPLNAAVPAAPLPDFLHLRLTHISRHSIEPLSNRQFQQIFGNRAFAWRGKKTLLRNFDALASSQPGNNGEKNIQDEDDADTCRG